MNYGFDVGAYKEFGNTSVGIVLKDVGGDTEILEQTLNLPMSIGVGVGQKFGNFTLASDVKVFEDYNSIGIGGEYSLRDEGINFYRLLLDAGVSARCRQVMGTIHGTEIFPMCCPDISRDTAANIADFCTN